MTGPLLPFRSSGISRKNISLARVVSTNTSTTLTTRNIPVETDVQMTLATTTKTRPTTTLANAITALNATRSCHNAIFNYHRGRDESVALVPRVDYSIISSELPCGGYYGCCARSDDNNDDGNNATNLQSLCFSLSDDNMSYKDDERDQQRTTDHRDTHLYHDYRAADVTIGIGTSPTSTTVRDFIREVHPCPQLPIDDDTTTHNIRSNSSNRNGILPSSLLPPFIAPSSSSFPYNRRRHDKEDHHGRPPLFIPGRSTTVPNNAVITDHRTNIYASCSSTGSTTATAAGTMSTSITVAATSPSTRTKKSSSSHHKTSPSSSSISSSSLSRTNYDNDCNDSDDNSGSSIGCNDNYTYDDNDDDDDDDEKHRSISRCFAWSQDSEDEQRITKRARTSTRFDFEDDNDNDDEEEQGVNTFMECNSNDDNAIEHHQHRSYLQQPSLLQSYCSSSSARPLPILTAAAVASSYSFDSL